MNPRALIFSFAMLLGAGGLVAAPAQAQLFGPSDEEVAREKAQDDQLAQLPQLKSQLDQDAARIQQLEDKTQSLTQSLSRATGANEELSHQISLMNDKLDRQQKDFAYRLCMLSAQQLGAGSDDQGLNCAAAGTSPPAVNGGAPARLPPGAALPPLGNESGTRGRPPGTLGSLSFNDAPGPQSSNGGSAQYDAAMNLLAKAQYAEASAAFRAYADANPDDEDLSSQAIYWVGNIAFVRQDYPAAARNFAELLKKYPHASRSPDGMLKLGQSLLAEGRTSDGCTTLGQLSKKNYPQASASTLAAATGVRKTSCSR